MNSSLFDPNNHVPEVTPDDSWGDAPDFHSETAVSPSVLPRRRSVTDRTSSPGAASADVAGIGLRIESNYTRGEATDSPQRLEVQEIGGSVYRLEDSMPTPPKVARQLTFHEKPIFKKRGENLTGEGRDWGKAPRQPKRWLVGIGLGVGVLVVSLLMVLPAINAPSTLQAHPEAGILSVVNEEKIAGMDALNLLLTKQPEAMEIFQTYARASQPDEVLLRIRDGRALTDTLHGSWHPLGISKSWIPSADSTWTVLDLANHPCAILSGDFPDHSKFTAYFINLGNQLQLDWKATTAFGTASFGQLAENQGDGHEIRGLISNAEYYSATWPEADYQCYRFVAPDEKTSIWCYARRGEPAEEAIGPLLNKGEIVQEAQSSQKITLRLEPGPSGALPNQWFIREMLHIDWVSP